MDKIFDILVIGGGINGVGIARDAAGRGWSVLLCEAGDLAQATSSASSKLVHGGLRYLEHYEFRLVRESLGEREVLLNAAPHIIWPLRFVLPHHKGLRPAWLLRLGLFLYDHIGGRKRLPPTRVVALAQDSVGAPLKADYTKGFEYSDCWVEDSRLVVLNALDAQERGAKICTRTRLIEAARVGDLWHAVLEDAHGVRTHVQARALVNAAGPWVSAVQRLCLAGSAGMGHNQPATHEGLRLVKGSHIVVPKAYEGAHCYTFQNADGRIVFMIPYEGDYTLIGTTDVPYEGDPRTVCATAEEIAYLCTLASAYLARPITPEQVVWHYAGVRPLYDDGESDASAITRDYVFNLDRGENRGENRAGDNHPALLSIYGGKITTYRKLAEHALRDLAGVLGFANKPWTAGTTLPGGDIANADFDAFLADLARRYPFVPKRSLTRLARAYGTRVTRILGQAQTLEALGQDFAGQEYGGVQECGGVYEAELAYLRDVEWARCGEDVLWRRSKLGLHLSAASKAAISDWFAGQQR
jgi:glycerol-3-phosphate dehydrogenase